MEMDCDTRYLEVHTEDDVRIRGTRVGLEHILAAYLAGALTEEICLESPSLTLEQVHGVLACYLGNRRQADGYLAARRVEAEIARTRQSESSDAAVVRRLRQVAEARLARVEQP